MFVPQSVTISVTVKKTRSFLKTQPGGFFWVLLGFRGFFLFQCAVLDAIHIK